MISVLSFGSLQLTEKQDYVFWHINQMQNSWQMKIDSMNIFLAQNQCESRSNPLWIRWKWLEPIVMEGQPLSFQTQLFSRFTMQVDPLIQLPAVFGKTINIGNIIIATKIFPWKLKSWTLYGLFSESIIIMIPNILGVYIKVDSLEIKGDSL